MNQPEIYQYANTFSCAVDSDGRTVLLCLRQRYPSFGEDSSMREAVSSPIVSVVLDAAVARELGKALHSLAEGSEADV